MLKVIQESFVHLLFDYWYILLWPKCSYYIVLNSLIFSLLIINIEKIKATADLHCATHMDCQQQL